MCHTAVTLEGHLEVLTMGRTQLQNYYWLSLYQYLLFLGEVILFC